MTTVVSGTLSYSDGSTPDVYYQSGDFSFEGLENGTARLKILGKHILVELRGCFLEELPDVDKIFRVAINVVESVILGFPIIYGCGFVYVLEKCRTHNRKLFNRPLDSVSLEEPLTFEINDLVPLVGKNSRLRWALRDFNQGLINREDCPFLFYRAICPTTN